MIRPMHGMTVGFIERRLAFHNRQVKELSEELERRKVEADAPEAMRKANDELRAENEALRTDKVRLFNRLEALETAIRGLNSQV